MSMFGNTQLSVYWYRFYIGSIRFFLKNDFITINGKLY